MNRTVRWMLLTFALLGVVLVSAAAWWASAASAFAASALRAEGTVVRLEESDRERPAGRERRPVYYPVVRYRTAGGKERTFRSSYGTYPPSHEVGDRVAVLYVEDDPRSGRLDGFGSLFVGPLIVGGLGAIFLLVGGVGAGVAAFSSRRARSLRATGTRVLTRFQAVERNPAVRVNGREPWRIVTQWVDPRTGLLHVFRSENLWFDPTPYVGTQEIAVVIDPADPRRHAMDVSFLPRMVA